MFSLFAPSLPAFVPALTFNEEKYLLWFELLNESVKREGSGVMLLYSYIYVVSQ